MTRLDCDEAMGLLDDYLKQELTPELAAEIRRHLEHCAPCFSQAQFEANFLSVVETRGRSKTCPGEVRARILAALAALRAEVRER
jgi:anti-sigma factor (TIGR02949 family)